MTDPEPTLRERLRAVPVLQAEPPPFEPDRAPSDPVALFLDWLDVAIAGGVPDPHAMTLATADAEGQVDARVLILKDVEATGTWSFATAVHSAKGRQLAANPQAALTFWWPSQGRQVRVRGPVRPAEPQVSAADLAARSPSARAMVLLDRQGRPLADEAVARREIEDAEARVRDDPGAGARNWAVYRVVAGAVEFWQADRTRMHRRLRYDRDGSGWARGLLWP